MMMVRRGRVTDVNDASRLTFPLQLVAVIVTTAVTVVATVYSTQASVRSELRDIKTRMELAVDVGKAEAKLSEERASTLRDAVDAMRRRQELQQYELQQLKETVLKNQR